MLSDEEKKEYEELKSLLYTGTISQYGKRNLIDMFEKQSKEIEILNKNMNLLREQNISYKQSIHGLKEENKKYIVQLTDEQYRKLVDIIRDKTSKEWEDKIKAKIEELDEAIKVNKECAKDNADRITVRLLNDEINELKKARNVLQSLLEKE